MKGKNVQSAINRAGDDRFLALVIAYNDGTATEPQTRELSDMLIADPAKRSAYAAICLHLRQVHEACAPTMTEAAAPEPASRTSIDRATSTFRVRRAAMMGIAAIVLIGAGMIAILAYVMSGSATPNDRPRNAPIASVVDYSDGLYVDDQPATRGEDYSAAAYAIETGTADLRLTNDVAITLRGQTRFSIDDGTRATLSRGTVEIYCPPGVTGYTVQLPSGARAVDLGTRFIVTTDTDRSSIVVTEGSVRVDRVDNGEVVHGPVITAGTQVALDSRGTIIDRRDTTFAPLAMWSPGRLEHDAWYDWRFTDEETSALRAAGLIDETGKIVRRQGDIWIAWTAQGPATNRGWGGLTLRNQFEDMALLAVGRAFEMGQYSVAGRDVGRNLLDADPTTEAIEPIPADDQPHRYVIHIERGPEHDRVSAWIDPDVSAATPPAPAWEADAVNLPFYRISVASRLGAGEWTFDDIRLGVTWRSVTAPESEKRIVPSQFND